MEFYGCISPFLHIILHNLIAGVFQLHNQINSKKMILPNYSLNFLEYSF